MSLVEDIYKRLAPKPTIYVRLSKDCVEIRHIQKGTEIMRTALTKFSNDRLIIADFLIAEEFCKQCITELLGNESNLLKKGLRVVLQIIDPEIKTITPTESRIYNDFAFNIGARELYTCEHQNRLTDDEVAEFGNVPK